jgi:hypothetical protein
VRGMQGGQVRERGCRPALHTIVFEKGLGDKTPLWWG